MIDIKRSKAETKLWNSLISLMEEFPYSEITVTMLVKHADVNRKTFYAYYPNKDELFCAIAKAMFADLFGCFMYPKPIPPYELDYASLNRDILRFLEQIQRYQRLLDLLITEETSGLALGTADQVILEKSAHIYLKTSGKQKVPQQFYVEFIRNFFMGIIDTWTQSNIENIEEGAAIIARLMTQSSANIFRYVKGPKK